MRLVVLALLAALTACSGDDTAEQSQTQGPGGSAGTGGAGGKGGAGPAGQGGSSGKAGASGSSAGGKGGGSGSAGSSGSAASGGSAGSAGSQGGEAGASGAGGEGAGAAGASGDGGSSGQGGEGGSAGDAGASGQGGEAGVGGSGAAGEGGSGAGGDSGSAGQGGSAGASGQGGEAGVGGAAGGSGEGGSAGSGDAGSGGSGGTLDGCVEASLPIYVLTASSELYRFDPPKLSFTLIGPLNCTEQASPYSMAIARNGTGYSVFTDGNLFTFDVTTAKCQPTTFKPGQEGFSTFGMGFSSDPGGLTDTLYVSESSFGGPSKGLAKIDTSSLALTPIGTYGAISARAELTGTGDGKLFGAFEGTPYVVAQIDTTNAKILSQAPQSAISYPPGSSNFAFAFWGGQFWIFAGPGNSTDLFTFDPGTKTTTKVQSSELVIVGAGVSTCAPITKP